MRGEPAAALPTPDLGGHMDIASAEPRMCPFLRAVDDDGSLGDPIRWPDQANRCTALGDAAPQSARQQEHACLASAHVNCPRFVRGALDMVEPTPAAAGARLQLTPAIVGALLVLAASFALSVGFVVANGGMDLPAAASGSQQAALGSAAPSPGASSESPAGTSVAPSASTEPSAGTAPSAEPSLAVTPSPSPTATPTPASTARPGSDRYALLKACPDAPDCWIYVVRSGDNLVSIARYFGVSFEVVGELNPRTKTTELVAGQELRLPPPTR
ncbi:MAG: LysM peptidoglycan-binding domain-containing protein [Candidatus Limnocylindrales bacterium]|nr:LysM peptidoglycan-binding domain-containing protein [Candidatus Limnocylindrales bacterium]